GNGNIFFCPGAWGTPFGANTYSPLFTVDATGFVRSSYFYNPRMLNAASDNNLRRYQTTSQLEPHRLFAIDSIYPSNFGGVGVTPTFIQHARDHGWNVLFTDGSVQFSRLTAVNNFDYTLVTQQLQLGETHTSWLQYNTLFNWLEQDH